MTPTVCIVIFGSDSASNISIICNQLGIPYGAVNPDETPNFKFTHIILSGGPKHVYNSDAYSIPDWVITATVPVLGICYGMQAIAKHFGGIVIAMPKKQYGPTVVREINDSHISNSMRWMSRLDRVIVSPNNFNVVGITEQNHIAAITDNGRWYGVQYHPEHPDFSDFDLFKEFLQK